MKFYVWHQETSYASNYMVSQVHQFQSNKVVLYYEKKIYDNRQCLLIITKLPWLMNNLYQWSQTPVSILKCPKFSPLCSYRMERNKQYENVNLCGDIDNNTNHDNALKY